MFVSLPFPPRLHKVWGVVITADSFPLEALGFNQPRISSIKTTLEGGVPDVISLPTGKFKPFHIQAPDWRHLLKMMARLRGSRIEPPVEVLAANKQVSRLRTVVQFVRVCTGFPSPAPHVDSTLILNLFEGRPRITRLEDRDLPDYRQSATLGRSQQVYER